VTERAGNRGGGSARHKDMQPHRTIALIIALLLVAAACGDSDGEDQEATATDEGPAPAPTVDFDRLQPSDVLVEIDTTPGLVPEINRARAFPELVLFGDGEVVVDHTDTDAEDLPEVPELVTATLDEDQAQAVVDEVYGVLGAEVGDLPVTDLPTTTLTVTVGSHTRALDVYGLGFDEDISDEQADAREEVQDVIDDVVDLEDFLDGVELEPFEPQGWLVVTEFTEDSPPSGPGEADALLLAELPLAPGLAATEEEPLACTELRGEEARDFVDEIVSGGDIVNNRSTFFEVEDRTVRLALRPVLTPGDSCADIAGAVER